MNWITAQILLVIATLASEGILVSGIFGIVQPVSLRAATLLTGVSIGGLLVSSLIKLGLIKL